MPTPIYHITSIANLPGILASEGLWCDGHCTRHGVAKTNIAHQHIKDRRARRAVPCAAGGYLADYVPFYFAPRSPMLYAIYRRNVAGYNEGQEPILHLVSSVELVATLGVPWCFTNGHADIALSQYFEELDDLNVVDWSIMAEDYWQDTESDPDRKRRRQAEFLVHDFFPWHAVSETGVLSNSMKALVEGVLRDCQHRPAIVLRENWYY